MSEQPKALRLAELCRSGALINNEWDEVADELTRLHAVESGAKVELMRRDNLIDSLHGLCESYRTQVEILQAASVEWSPAYTRGPARQSAPVAAVPALVPLSDEQIKACWVSGAVGPFEFARASIAEFCRINGLTVGYGAQPIKDTP